MDQVVIYPNDSGGVAVITPAPECGLPVMQIALKDVPPGKPFLIISGSSIPQTTLFFQAFEADFSNPDGYGADYGTGSTKDVVG